MPLLAESRPRETPVKIFSQPVAVWLYLINAGVAFLVAFGLPLDHAQVGAITTIATAVFAILTAVLTRPVDVPALTGAVATGLAAAAAFGMHLTDAQIGSAVAFLSVVLALLLHQTVAPAPALQRDKR